MDDSSRAGDRTSRNIAGTLDRLKRQGSRLLVTGVVGADVRAAQTRRLLGSPDEQRTRILALADGSSPSSFLPDSVTPTDDRVHVVEHADTVRSGATASAEPLPPGGLDDPLSTFHTRLLRTIRNECDAVDGFEPAELRVAVVGLGTLVDRDGFDRVARLVRSLGDAVVDHRGMFHCHVAGPASAPELSALSPSFDARIDLRHRDRLPPEQRWSITETGESTEWMLL